MKQGKELQGHPQAQPRFGLMTAITMIIGICIGSGIFFKSDNILVATGGSVALGVMVFALGAVAIVFGGLAMGELASRTHKPGGIFTYFEEFAGSRWACAFGWFQVFIYYPTITIVVSWVVGIYGCILFNIQAGLLLQVTIGLAFCALCFLYNVLWAKFGAGVQNVSTAVKLIPLALLGIGGMLYGNPIEGLRNVVPQTGAGLGLGWLAAVGPIAYSYDGWVVSTSISHEVKDARRNMPRALTLAPLVILVIYVSYFIGITCYVGPGQVMSLGDAHVTAAAASLFGNTFAKAITVFVVISVMGTVNGLVMGYIRMPYSLALRPGMMPGAKWFGRMNEKLGIPVYSALLSFGLCAFWLVVHYFTAKWNLLPNSDVSEIAIAISYLFYLVLYWQIFKLHRAGEISGKWKGLCIPLLAACGSVIILTGGLQNPRFLYFVALCGGVALLSQLYYRKRAKATQEK